jgi:NAD(P)-dependent dehydrogenase (short-subunit alcohol dehydrogenase family)
VELEGKVIVVTGAASGIGAALCRRFAQEKPAGIVAADLDFAGADRTAADVEAVGCPAHPVSVDVGKEADVQAMIAAAVDRFGPVDLLCQNAGIARDGGADASDADWAASWSVNLMAHVYGARAVLPSMLERGSGYLLHTCSAAGLLTNPGAAPYAVTKHAAVAFAEWLSMTHGDAGVRVSALCPQGVNTPMLTGGAAIGAEAAEAVKAAGGVVEPEDVAEVVVAGIRDERFLILPHPEVAEYIRRKAADHDRWLAGMRRLSARAFGRG